MKKAIKILCFIALGVAFVTALGFGTMYLWNWLVPTLFKGPVVTFWQALGLLLLCKLLFGFPGKDKEGGFGAKKRRMKERWKAKMEGLSTEEREKVKDHFSRCSWNWHKDEDEARKEQ
ncbi:hypothetical protein ACWKWU_19745 [Chitinophaga lutea]